MPKQTTLVMKTTLPTLSYHPTGILWTDDVHSSAYTSERAYPRTDLANFIPWIGFETEIDQAITARMSAMSITFGAQYDIGSMPKIPQDVSSEEDVRGEAKVQLHDLVVEMLGILGIVGRFMRSDTGNNQIVGEPDFSWLRKPTWLPKVVVEYKTKWAAPLEDLPGYFSKNDRSVLERQSVDAVHQLYGYMTFNDNKYGVLSNMQRAWFFQRVETADFKGKTLQYYGPIEIDSTGAPSMLNPNGLPSMLKAFVGIILLAELTSTWFHTSPTLSKAPPNRYFGTSLTAIRSRDAARQAGGYRSTVVAGSYEILPLDPRLCHFDRTSVRHAPQRGCTVRATLARGVLAGGSLDVFCKVVDLFQRKDSIYALDREVRNYATLHNLQGEVIPRVRGYYDIWGLLRVLALEDVGTAIPETWPLDTQTRRKMTSALARIHSKGYVHGDIARRNFCKKDNVVYLVDLETLAPGSSDERAAELSSINAFEGTPVAGALTGAFNLVLLANGVIHIAARASSIDQASGPSFFRQIFGLSLGFYSIPFGEHIGFQWSFTVFTGICPFILNNKLNPPRPADTLLTAHRLLYRGALSLPDSHLLLDGLTFTARLDSPSKNNQLLQNPLALALESMRGRPSLRFMGVIKLHDGNVWWDESGEIEMDIHPRATLTRIYFENIFCLTPFASTSRSSTSTSPYMSDVGIKVALGDSDGPETTQVVIFARPKGGSPHNDDDGRTLDLIVVRLTPRPLPTQGSSLRLPRPDDPTPRKPPVSYGVEVRGKDGARRELKHMGSIGPLASGRQLKRVASVSNIPAKKKKLVNVSGSVVADLGSGVRLGDAKTAGTKSGLFKIPDIPLRGKSGGKGKGKQVERERDVFGSTEMDERPPPQSGSKGKRKRAMDEDGDQVGGVVEMERANKDAIKRCTLDHLYKAKDPTNTTIDKSHPEFRELFGWISRGVGYALRAHMKVRPVDETQVGQLVRAHMDMYIGGYGGTASGASTSDRAVRDMDVDDVP
ncbi:hypothetical protein D9615_009168 [Tricholomella constricta]|uniref:Uncharacterized protein n=1 Tax=Tricholomella constricta TaxID=117010 RepID=A0A8H5LZW3_9AGAR|nr:hypothetical protein D9615_009168 [Tricholomella constricta]